MNVKRIFAGLSAAAIAATMAMSVSATKLSDLVYPSETDAEMNDAWYGIGAMGFFMNRSYPDGPDADAKWGAWNQGSWIGIDAEGKLNIEYTISPALADTTLSDKGALGSMGVMVLNMPEEGYPYEVTISDAKFVTTDGNEIILDNVNAITEATQHAEGGFRIILRPDDAVNDAGEITDAATPGLEGMEKEGGFNGGTLSMVIDFGAPPAADGGSNSESATDSGSSGTSSGESSGTSSASSSSSSSSTSSSGGSTTTTSKSTTTTTTTTTSTTDANTDNTNTGAVAGVALALMAVGAAGVVISKKNH